MLRKINNKYLHFILTTMSLSIILILLAVTYILNTTFSIKDESLYKKAFDWQMKNRGVVGITDGVSDTYKNKMTGYAIPKNNIDTLVLGSSTLMSVKGSLIENHNVFNGSKNSNPLFDSISKANYYIATHDTIKYVLIGFDWALGKPYQKYNKPIYQPTMAQEDKISLSVKIKDAISYQRVKIIASNIYNNFLNQPETYQCPTEDNIGTDSFFIPLVPRNCHGFRFDGSATFSNQLPLTEKKWKILLETELDKYKKMLSDSLGKIELGYLDDFNEIDKVLKSRGGKLVIIIPPLMPGATVSIQQSEDGIYLKETMNTLLKFVSKNNIDILDASKSEKYDCVLEEFMDVHHAFPECYKKILKNVFE